MEQIRFEVISRKKTRFLITVHAMAKYPCCKMDLNLEADTGKVLYPVKIEQAIFGTAIVLDSEDFASCSVPPSIPETMVDSVVSFLSTVHEVIAAARELVKEEQEKFMEGKRS